MEPNDPLTGAKKPVDSVDAARAALIPPGRDASEPVGLNGDDAARMVRLAEEVISRVMEMSLILSRTLELPAPESIGEALQDLHLEAVSGPRAGVVVAKRHYCLWYDFTNMVCEIRPCGG